MRTFFLFCAFVSLTACSAAEDAATDSLDLVHTSATFSGTWRGVDGSSGPATGHFEQRGVSATAALVLDGHKCVERIALHGEVGFDGWSGSADVGSMQLRYSSNPEISELLADYEAITTGPCPGEKGNVRLFR